MADVMRLVVIGTAEGCDVRITDDPYVSNRHARAGQNADGTAWIEDLGSMNGTWVRRGGQLFRVRMSMELRPGDVVKVGRTLIPWTVDGD